MCTFLQIVEFSRGTSHNTTKFFIFNKKYIFLFKNTIKNPLNSYYQKVHFFGGHKMLFNSMAYAVFLPIVFIIYWIIPQKCRWILLLVASYYFYMSWNPKYVVLIFFTTVISYCAGVLLEGESNKKRKNWIVAGTCVLCLGVLFFFKYFNFFYESVTDILKLFTIQLNPITLNVLLPVGISFYTFQTLSYVVDVYKGDIQAEHHFGYYATFISFFPQLVAGPIERTRNLLPQIKATQTFDYNKASYGAKLMLWGYFKKLVIADVVSTYVSTVFDDPLNFKGQSGFSFVIVAFLFSIQIYCDFSGYSDIAIGTAKLLGIDLMTNFQSPYFSQSIREFWSRWHISLSTWFRDYVYIPLGGNRVGKIRHILNLMITFLVSGLWHGANWTFVVWGGIHGLAQVAETTFLPKQKKSNGILISVIKTLIVFAFCTLVWVFFVSNSVYEAVYVIVNMFRGISSPIAYLHDGFSNIGLYRHTFLRVALCIVALAGYDLASLKVDCISWLNNRNAVVRHGAIIIMLGIILLYGYAGQSTFVYFQF
jgi:D-alanyl-lipoteichoic acid acyltransferase DltB (MBOAT superfamily)